jgi:alkylation response protein AidB-like acyl-CoA dehydrogenase
MAQAQAEIPQFVPQPLTVLNEEEQMFAASVREFAEAEVKPYVREMDEQQKMKPEIIQKCFELGLMGIEPGDEYGGSGGTFFMACLAIEEIARVDASLSVMVDVNNTLTINAFLNYGNEALRQKYVTRLCTDTVGAYCLSEAGSGSDAFALQTRAEDKDGHYLLNGQKLWITNGGEAGIFIVFRQCRPSARATRASRLSSSNANYAGFTVGKKEDKLGIRASSTCELLFEDCKSCRRKTCWAKWARATRSPSRR